MDLKLQGKTALVTGAGSQGGFGEAICTTLAEEGCDIIVGDIDFEGAKKTAAKVEVLKRKALAVQCDVTKKEAVQAMIAQALERFGQIDILVNNAGAVLGRDQSFVDQDENLWDREIALNLKGYMLCAQAVLPSMVKRKYGKIINIGSDSVKATLPMVSTYHIAKAGVHKFTRELARTYVTEGIHVNCVSPGWSVATNLGKNIGIDTKALEEILLKTTPLGRGTSPQDVAVAVAFLASDLAADIVGQILSVSGGESFQ